jgi:hypothetical protein
MTPPPAVNPAHVPMLAAALAAASVTTIGAADLAHGGLLPLAVSAVVAAFVAVPLAGLEPGLSLRSDPLSVGLRTFGRGWAFLLVGAALAPVMGLPAGRVVVVASLVGVWALRARASAVVNVLIAATVVTLAASVALAVAAAPGGPSVSPLLTLLEPRTDTWRAWLPLAIGRGLLAAGVGFGVWQRAPGGGRGPWLAAGICTLIALLRALRAAACWEAGVDDDGWLLVTNATLGLSAATALVATAEGAAVATTAAAASALWFGGPAHAAAPLLWAALGPLPATLVGVEVARARARRGLPLLAAAAGLGALVVAWPGAPPDVLPSVALALGVVVLVWVSGVAAANQPEPL